jgi:hypothetical protein
VSTVITATATLKTFSCSDDLRVMAFAQLTYRESLRDIVACLNAVPEKMYHLGKGIA